MNQSNLQQNHPIIELYFPKTFLSHLYAISYPSVSMKLSSGIMYPTLLTILPFKQLIIKYAVQKGINMERKRRIPMEQFQRIFIYFINRKISQKMNKQTVPQLNSTLQALNRFFKEKSAQFCTTINKIQGKFSAQDYQQFSTVVEGIKQYATTSINIFFQRKIAQKSSPYETTIFQFQQHSSQTRNSLKEFRQELEQSTLQLKKTQKKKEQLLQHFSIKYRDNFIMKKVWRIIKINADEEKQKRRVNQEAVKVYHRSLMRKVFFPWRQLTYREGYQNTVKRETSQDIMQIHAQYQSIINILKDKINDTDDMIKIKKAAKGEFAYALSKNLLKTISNLSMEVMSLNQLTLNDNEASQKETKRFMQDVDDIITLKLKKVRDFKKSLCADEEGETNQIKKKKKIMFV